MTPVRRAVVPFAALLVGLAGLLFFLMRDHAYHPTDDGFLLAYSWRLTRGEVPYRDFIFERPPLTIYLHAVWLALPDGWQIQAGRLAFYSEMVASTLFITIWAVARGLRASTPTLAITGGVFLIAVHNFPPMPWPTVDGVFFASAGIAGFLAWRDGGLARWLALSVVALTFATLAKQSFAPLLAVVTGAALVSSLRARDVRTALAAIVPPSLIAGAFLTALIAANAFAPFLQQITQPTQMRPTPTNPWSGDFVAVAVKPYLLALTPGIAPILALVTVAFLGRDRPRVGWAALPVAFGVLVLAAALMPTDAYGSGFVLFYGTAAIALAETTRVLWHRSAAAPLGAYALVLLAGWCTSLSFAYQSPILAVGMLGPIVALALPLPSTRAGTILAGTGFAIAFAMSLVTNLNLPYRDTPRDQLTANLGDIYPRFGDLYTNPVNAARHRELRDLTTHYALDSGREFVVFTAFPLAHFLTHTDNPLSVDWLEPQEFLGNDERLRRELDRSRPVLIVQRQPGESVAEGPAPLTCAQALATVPEFAAELFRHSALVYEGAYFCVYVP